MSKWVYADSIKGSNIEITPYQDTQYSPYDAKLTIGGERMKFIVDETKSNEFQKTHFKFLGRWISVDLDDHKVRDLLHQIILERVCAVDRCAVNGLMKLWLYQFYVIPSISWPFLIHDINLYFVEELQKHVNVYLRKWAGLFKKADPGVLYRPKTLLGLGLTSLVRHFKSMQIVKCHICKRSEDMVTKTLYERYPTYLESNRRAKQSLRNS